MYTYFAKCTRTDKTKFFTPGKSDLIAVLWCWARLEPFPTSGSRWIKYGCKLLQNFTHRHSRPDMPTCHRGAAQITFNSTRPTQVRVQRLQVERHPHWWENCATLWSNRWRSHKTLWHTSRCCWARTGTFSTFDILHEPLLTSVNNKPTVGRLIQKILNSPCNVSEPE